MKKPILLFVLFLMTQFVNAQSFYDINTIQTIQITFTQSNWDYMLDTATSGSEGYIMAQTVAVNGVVFDSVGVKYKGNSTYNANQVKNPFHIELDTYKNQDYQGYTDIKMSNVAKDPSFLREVLSYQILRQYMHAPLSNYVNVYVNGNLIGLYVSSESISKKFVSNHFYSNDNAFFKCNPPAGAGPGTSAKPNLVYLGTDSSLYYAAYEMKSDGGWAELISLCDNLKNNTGAIENYLDVDRALWMLAFDNTLVNLDSYIGGFAQNYYLYKDNNNRFNPVVWDLNESFGTFSQTGTINLQNTTAKQQMTQLLHLTDANWPLVQKLLSIPQYKRMYIAHMRTMLAENFANNSYVTSAQNLQSIINSAVNADPNKFFSYAQYQSNLNTDVSSGMTSAPGLTNLMNGRNTWLNTQTDFTNTPPTISNINPSSSNPVINSVVTIMANVTNANYVYLGYRYNQEAPFTKVTMYDDGAHNDGAAGDNVYGVDISVNAAYTQYYIYAENNLAGMFSPVRAEHEFYSLYATIATITSGEVVINELMASNSSTAADPNGEYDDWIELYNNSSNFLSFDNAYLSDSYTTPLKWKFPDNTTIAPNGYLIVWADGDTLQSGLHADFKLSATGEQVMLSYANGYVVDSISFGIQTTDTSYLRCPNGTGSFVFYAPSFNSENCVPTAIENIDNSLFSLYPNPVKSKLYIKNSDVKITTLEILNAYGQRVYLDNAFNGNEYEIDFSYQPSGMYVVRINNTSGTKIIKQ